MSDRNGAIKLIRQFILSCAENNLPIDKVILFGSVSRNEAGKWSDIDVAFFSKNFVGNRFADSHLLNQIAVKKKDFLKIESHPYPTSYFKNETDPMVSEIKKTGIEIKIFLIQ